MIVSHIVAISKNGVIGHKGKIPWHSKEDFRFFKEKTMGHALIMGRKTQESIGKVLPGRLNIILTRKKLKSPSKHLVYIDDIEKALELARQFNPQEAFVAGGAEIYRLTESIVDKIYLTRIDLEVEGDAFFDTSVLKDFKLTSHKFVDADPKFTLETYSRLQA